MKCPCEQCICLAMCINKIERYRTRWMMSSISKHCEIISDYLFAGDINSHSRLQHARKFYNNRKDKI